MILQKNTFLYLLNLLWHHGIVHQSTCRQGIVERKHRHIIIIIIFADKRRILLREKNDTRRWEDKRSSLQEQKQTKEKAINEA